MAIHNKDNHTKQIKLLATIKDVSRGREFTMDMKNCHVMAHMVDS